MNSNSLDILSIFPLYFWRLKVLIWLTYLKKFTNKKIWIKKLSHLLKRNQMIIKIIGYVSNWKLSFLSLSSVSLFRWAKPKKMYLCIRSLKLFKVNLALFSFKGILHNNIILDGKKNLPSNRKNKKKKNHQILPWIIRKIRKTKMF